MWRRPGRLTLPIIRRIASSAPFLSITSRLVAEVVKLTQVPLSPIDVNNYKALSDAGLR